MRRNQRHIGSKPIERYRQLTERLTGIGYRQSLWQALHDSGFGIGHLQHRLLWLSERNPTVRAHQLIWLYPRRHRVMFNISPAQTTPGTGQRRRFGRTRSKHNISPNCAKSHSDLPSGFFDNCFGRSALCMHT